MKPMATYGIAQCAPWHGTTTTSANIWWIQQLSFLVYYYGHDQRSNITNKDVSRAIKALANDLEYPTAKGIPINQINTHSLHSRGANALFLVGYLDTQLQKMGWLRGATFKEYLGCAFPFLVPLF
jgi:hypothetical protein